MTSVMQLKAGPGDLRSVSLHMGRVKSNYHDYSEPTTHTSVIRKQALMQRMWCPGRLGEQHFSLLKLLLAVKQI